MLSRLLNSAKNLLKPISEIEYKDQSDDTKNISVDMVTTRQRGKATGDEDFTIVELPTSTRKRSRSSAEEADLAVGSTEPNSSASKRVKTLPVRAKDEEPPNRSSRLVVEIPISNINLGGTPSSGSKKVSKPKEIIEIEDSEESDEDPEIIDSEVEDEQPEQETPSRKTISESPKKRAGSPKSAHHEVDVVNPKHRRFRSEEPELEFFSTAAETIELEDESSDDDAPEVVETLAAQKSVELKARDAARAIEE